MNVAKDVSSKVFIDTNIWLYAFSDSQDKVKSQQAKSLIRRESQIALSSQVVNEVSVNLLRKFHAKEDDVCKLIHSFYDKYIIVEHDRSVFLNASNLRILYPVSYWDSLIIASALTAGASILYTEDLHDGLTINKRLTIVNPLKSEKLLNPP